jgi:hypothetical protein
MYETLPLDDPLWRDLKASPGGTGGFAAELLRQVYSDVDSEDSLTELQEQICHQNSFGEVAYAVVPHLVEIAKRSSHDRRVQCLVSIAYTLASALEYPDVVAPSPPRLRDAYERSKLEALQLATAELCSPLKDPAESAYLLQLVAAVQGHATIAKIILSWPTYFCPHCGEDICSEADEEYDASAGAHRGPQSPSGEEQRSVTGHRLWWRWW